MSDDPRRWWHVYSQDGYVAIERAVSAREAEMIATAKRPGYEGCHAKLYEPEYEKETEERAWDKAHDEIRRIEECLTKLS